MSPIDTIRFNETPEGVDLGLRVAGPVPRALAFVVDLVVRGALYLVLIPLTAFAGVGLGLMLLGFFLLEWFYPVLFEVLKGATPGKFAMGLSVVHDDGTPVGWSASMIRNLLRAVDFLPILYGVGLVSCLVDRDFRRLGDLAAGTLVVHRERARGAAAIPDVPSRPLPPGLDLQTQQAILAFAERGPRLSAARRIELAEILTAEEGRRGAAAVDRVAGWASWLARGQG
ncbi:RDD family protein [Imhoffiella purpurea]|uniref:Integral membrane protein (Rhomboid family) n=1 Tax=Imhoffiella purpurea TaxID=1249627 RepID=W9VBF7_9GAMM|nr:RDD family protein [Imhoffiella purpurea]EXJ13357.1 integral membrane protein (Rhomboid family) [Imhoffiella purpurea]